MFSFGNISFNRSLENVITSSNGLFQNETLNKNNVESGVKEMKSKKENNIGSVFMYEKTFKELNSILFNKNEQSFYIELLYTHVMELTRGFFPARRFKTRRNGTKIRFRLIDKNNYMQAQENYNKPVLIYNKKFNGKMPLLDLSGVKWSNETNRKESRVN